VRWTVPALTHILIWPGFLGVVWPEIILFGEAGTFSQLRSLPTTASSNDSRHSAPNGIRGRYPSWSRPIGVAGIAGGGVQHQREQSGHLAVLRQEGADQAREPDRLGGQIVTYGIGVGASRQVALVEDEEEDGEYA
jgi:hypothetical protein